MQKYVERAARFDGVQPETPIFIVPEGNEPTFFTTFFSWDPSKVNVSIYWFFSTCSIFLCFEFPMFHFSGKTLTFVEYS